VVIYATIAPTSRIGCDDVFWEGVDGTARIGFVDFSRGLDMSAASCIGTGGVPWEGGAERIRLGFVSALWGFGIPAIGWVSIGRDVLEWVWFLWCCRVASVCSQWSGVASVSSGWVYIL
jgi:hypothetical protein